MRATCAICKKAVRLFADMDFETQQSRGSLCQNCLCGIADFGRDPDLLKRAADYLTKQSLGELG